MPKDLQELITKAKIGYGNGKGVKDAPEKPVATKVAADFDEDAPDELVLKYAEDLKQQEVLTAQDRRVKEGMTFLLSAADSIASASRCREDH